MKLVTPEELADWKRKYLDWQRFVTKEFPSDEYGEPDDDPYYRMICTLEALWARDKTGNAS
jgi:hypothetical protein